MKLQRFLVENTRMARRKAALAIEDGRVAVDGKMELRPYHNIDPGQVRVTLDGKLITPRKNNDIMASEDANLINKSNCMNIP